jgi:hypothetical protein
VKVCRFAGDVGGHDMSMSKTSTRIVALRGLIKAIPTSLCLFSVTDIT